MLYTIYYLDDIGNFESAVSKEQEEKLLNTHPEIKAIIQEGKTIYEDVYEE